MSQEDKKALSVFEESVRLKDSHYEVEIPWKNYSPCLPNNRPVAEHRLKLLKKKLTRNPDMRDKYSNFIHDLVDTGYARKVPRDHSNKNGNGDVVWYLPQYSVTHPKKPEKAYDESFSIVQQNIKEHPWTIKPCKDQISQIP